MEGFDNLKIKKTVESLSDSNIFLELMNHLRHSRKISAYAKDETFEQRLSEVKKELVELVEANESLNIKHVVEELGDVIWDVLFLLVLMEEKGISSEEVIRERIEKQIHRLPHVYEGKIVDLEEEKIIFKMRKSMKKNGNN